MAKKWYAVQAGRKPGIYTTWADCEAQVKGFGGAIYKSFTSLEEAQAFLEPRGEKRQSLADFFAESASSGQATRLVNPVKSGKSANPTSTRIKGSFQRSGQGKSATSTSSLTKDSYGPDVLVAYIDGSFDKRIGSVGSGGVIFYQGQEETFSLGTKDPQYTEFWNVSGELLAAMHVMQVAKDKGAKACALFYDYMGIEMWATHKWKRNNALTQAYAAFAQDMMKSMTIHFNKVAAHTGDRYNEMADQLAKAGLHKVV